MRKIPFKLENPFDDILINISNEISPLCKKLNLSPNKITTLGNIFFIISIIYIFNKKYKLASLFYIFAYFCDCLDGHFARKYNMATSFGDYYDHISDLLRFIIILYILYKKISKKRKQLFIIIITILFIFINIHLGCQEKFFNKTANSFMLSFTKKICFTSNPTNILKYSKFFGCGTLQLVITYYIFTLDNE
jgi:phosphatidylglycerophosphate synthase